MKNKMSFEDHIEIGSRLKEIYDYLLKLDMKLLNVYGCNHYKGIGFNARIATGAVGVLRSALDDSVGEEYKDTPYYDSVNSVYYGKR